MAKVWNRKIFSYVNEQSELASIKIAEKKGPCPDAADFGIMQRFTNKTAIAPTASISIICGESSPGIEPFSANSYNHKTLSGTRHVKNRHLKKLLKEKGFNDEETWTSITTNEGSVKHLDFLTDHEKDVFKTAFEIDQKWLIELAADRTPFISQSQSLNIFLASDVHKKELHKIHFQAWEKGIKSMYYLRSKSLQRTEVIAKQGGDANYTKPVLVQNLEDNKYEECLACQ